VVLVFHGPYNQLIALGFLGDFLEDVFVFLRIGGTPDDQRHVDRPEDFLHGGGGILRTGILAVGIRALELEHDHFRAVVVDALFGPGGGVAHHVFERRQSRFRPFLGFRVPDLHGDPGFVGHLAFELVERITAFAANDHGRIPFSQGDFLDAAGIGFLKEFEAQFYLLIGGKSRSPNCPSALVRNEVNPYYPMTLLTR